MSDTKNHGFLFKAEMIRAILANLKFQTRRVCTAHNSLIDGTGEGIRAHWQHLDWSRAWVDKGPSPVGNPGPYWKVPCNHLGEDADLEVIHRIYPRVQAGDLLWGKETWKVPAWDGCKRAVGVCYRATDETVLIPRHDHLELAQRLLGRKWRSSMLMPRWASRLELQVLHVGTERVNGINNNDASAEGTPDLRTPENNWEMRDCFRKLWNSINGKKPGHRWEDNPPVWIYNFARAA